MVDQRFFDYFGREEPTADVPNGPPERDFDRRARHVFECVCGLYLQLDCQTVRTYVQESGRIYLGGAVLHVGAQQATNGSSNCCKAQVS